MYPVIFMFLVRHNFTLFHLKHLSRTTAENSVFSLSAGTILCDYFIQLVAQNYFPKMIYQRKSNWLRKSVSIEIWERNIAKFGN